MNRLSVRASERQSGTEGLPSRFHPSSFRLHPSRRCGGFTLIELMVVIVIIAILAGIVIGTAGYAQRKAANNRAKAEIAAMEAALEAYKLDTGAYPAGNGAANSSVNIYNAVAGGPKKYMTFRANQLGGNTIVDPFGKEYMYQSPGINNPATFDLWSFGANRNNDNGANDDITNWQQ